MRRAQKVGGNRHEPCELISTTSVHVMSNKALMFNAHFLKKALYSVCFLLTRTCSCVGDLSSSACVCTSMHCMLACADSVRCLLIGWRRGQQESLLGAVHRACQLLSLSYQPPPPSPSPYPRLPLQNKDSTHSLSSCIRRGRRSSSI